MTISLKTLAYAIASALISIVLHLLLLAMADRIQIGGLPPLNDSGKAHPQRLQVKSVDLEQRTSGSGQAGDSESIATDLAEELAESLKDKEDITPFLQTESLQLSRPPKAQITGLGRNVSLPEADVQEPASMPAGAPGPEILEIMPEDITPSHQLSGRPRVPDVPRAKLGNRLLPGVTDDTGEGDRGGTGLSMRLSPPPISSPVEDLPEMKPSGGQTASDSGQSEHASETDLPPLDEGIVEPEGAVAESATEPEAIDRLVNAELTIYDPPEEKTAYFRLDLTPNPRSEKLRAIPKDVLFLIDCSTSIEPAKLEIFKDTVGDTLNYLNPADRFNVVSFRVAPHNLFDTYVQVRPEKLRKARKYVKRLYRQGLTDVYAALAPFVDSESRNTDRPLTVFVFTDGQSTVDDKLDNETLLRKIDATNREQISIYSSSCGKKTNRFLLDLLAYTNRGRPLHREKLADFQGAITGYIRSHTDIIVSDILYSATGNIEDEMYPRQLPLMYRGETMSIYGRWPKNADEIGIQLIGQSARNEPLDYVYNMSRVNAERGTPRIKRGWISQKIFYLIAEKTLNPSPELERQLQAMLAKYNLATPYSN
ncbi:MAG: VWA domain-containing protein [Lentisphaeria bacterium]